MIVDIKTEGPTEKKGIMIIYDSVKYVFCDYCIKLCLESSLTFSF